LGAISAVSILITDGLEGMLPFRAANGMSPGGGIADMLFFYLLLVATAFIIKDSPGNRRPIPRPNTARTWLFLCLKLGLALPILQCTIVAVVVVNVAPLSLGFYAACVLLFRWIFTDQRRRCPVCLRLLTDPIRIGTPSQTFLQWYGSESICARGHGLLHSPEISASYSREHKWLDLDDSWRALRSAGAEFRQ
jgi:hypothetical protein